jgi:DNA gyrase subunit A
LKKEKKENAVVITEIPYMVNKATLITQIAELIRDKKLKDISDLRDESSKGKIRIVIEMKKDIDPKLL